MIGGVKLWNRSGMSKNNKCKSYFDHDKIYAPYILSSYPLKHSWICRLCGESGVDVGYNVRGLTYEQLLNYFPSMNNKRK